MVDLDDKVTWRFYHAACVVPGQLQPLFPGGGLFLIGATGTGSTTTSPACGATGSGLVATSGAFAGGTVAQGKGGPCNEAGDTKPRQDPFQVVRVHNCLLTGGKYESV